MYEPFLKSKAGAQQRKSQIYRFAAGSAFNSAGFDPFVCVDRILVGESRTLVESVIAAAGLAARFCHQLMASSSVCFWPAYCALVTAPSCARASVKRPASIFIRAR